MSDAAPQKKPRETRRRFLKRALLGAGGIAVAGLGYSLLEAGWVRVLAVSIRVPNLPAAFRGTRVVFLTDIHHGVFTGIDYVREVVRTAQSLRPDLVVLGGDYVQGHARYIAPCIEALGALRAPLGVYAVLGNHDHWEGPTQTSRALRRNGITELTNTGVWLRAGGQRLRLAGVGDLWEDRQDLPRALGDASPSDACILLSHNPDYVEEITDRRVGLVLAGHSHGGQVVLPGIGAPIVFSRYGQKYLHGLVQGPHTQVFVSRGVGTIVPPVRFRCRPEIVDIRLRS